MTGPFDQGQTYAYRQTVTDSTGAPGNAGTVTVTITLPDGTTATPTVVNTATGVYDIAYLTAQVGLHNVRGSATGGVLGSDVDVWEDNFTVEQPARTFISVDEATNHLRASGVITTVADREQLRWLCMVATDLVEGDLERVIVRRTFTETHDGNWDRIILHSKPVVSITSVTENGTLLTGSDYFLNARTGTLYRGTTLSLRSFASGTQNIVVVGVAGYSNPPRVARKVALNAVQAMWQTSQQASHPLVNEEFAAGLPLGALEGLTPIEMRRYERLRAAPGSA